MGRKKGMHGQPFQIDQSLTTPLKEPSAPSDWLRSCRALWNRLLGKTGPKVNVPFSLGNFTKGNRQTKTVILPNSNSDHQNHRFSWMIS